MHISIDIESLATTPDAVILSIGAAMFDTQGLHGLFYAVLDVGCQDRQRRRRDCKTLEWWEQQSDEARKVLTQKDREPVLYALGRLHEFVNKSDPEGIWALGPHFDIAAIEHLCVTYGVPVPWHYRLPRDLRTVRSQFMKKFPAGNFDHIKSEGGVAHNALDDAVWQARALIHMNQQLGGFFL